MNELNHKYKVIVLGNSAGWCGRSWEDLRSRPESTLINKHFPGEKVPIDYLIRFHYSERVNKVVNLPLKELWYDYFFENLIANENEDIVLIVYDGNKLGNDEGFLKYLKHKCVNLKMVYIITNEVKYCIATRNNFFEKLNAYYDIVYGFHCSDKIKYGIPIIPLIYSKTNISYGKTEKIVFFAGEAKTRLPRILNICNKIKTFGFEARIVALHVDDEFISSIPKTNDFLLYNHPISYDDVIRYTQESAVIVEVPQDGLEAITIKTCEAIYYNKLLITTNDLIKKMPFYDPRYMLCIKSVDDITEEFLSRWDKVKYNQDAVNYFSVNTFLNRVFDDLKLS